MVTQKGNRARPTSCQCIHQVPPTPPTSPENGLPLLLRATPATGLVCALRLALSGSCLKEAAAPMPRGPSSPIADPPLRCSDAAPASWVEPKPPPRAMVGVVAACGRW